MQILDGFIRTDEIVGISGLLEIMNGNRFHYSFSVITKSSSVPFNSVIIEDVHIATKAEQGALASFKNEYNRIKHTIAMLIGESTSILNEHIRQAKIEMAYQKLSAGTDAISTIVTKSKLKNKEKIIEHLGDVWVAAGDIKELSNS